MVNEERIVQTLIDLIKIDSPSGEEGKIAAELKERFHALGAEVEIDQVGNLIARFQGAGESLILSAHLDTVEPGRNIEPFIENGVMTSKGETVLGADAKAGISVILEALTVAREQNLKTLPVEVVLSVDEETGSKGAKALDPTKLKSKRAVVFDGDEEVTHANHAAPGYYSADIVITGRAAHAGVEPEKGISSIRVAAELVNKLTLGRIDEETTANVGTISGGSARNAVPEKTEIKAEFRSRNGDKLEQQVNNFKKAVEEVLQANPEAKITYELDKKFDSFSISLDDPFIVGLQDAYKGVGLQGDFKPTGGGSDANFFNAKGVKVVVVGTGVRDMHTTKESLKISETVQAAEFCLELIKN